MPYYSSIFLGSKIGGLPTGLYRTIQSRSGLQSSGCINPRMVLLHGQKDQCEYIYIQSGSTGMVDLFQAWPICSLYWHAIIYSGTLIIGPLLGRTKTGQISKVVTLSRWSECMTSPTAGQMIRLYKKSQTGRSKSGPISKVVRLSGWSHSKVPLYIYNCKRDWQSAIFTRGKGTKNSSPILTFLC